MRAGAPEPGGPEKRMALPGVRHAGARDHGGGAGAGEGCPDSCRVGQPHPGVLANGRVQRMSHDAFELEAEPAGPPSFGGCRLVDQRLIYRDMLVDVREERVCGVSR